MMNVYAKVGGYEQLVDEAGDGAPEGWILMREQRPDSIDFTAQPDGTWAITQETLTAKQALIENAWRENEMPKAQQYVTAIEYGEEGIPGTAQQWQKYWLALRKWTGTNPDFPDRSKRPVAPS